MQLRSTITLGWGHVARFLRGLSGWKYANWIITFLFATAALMATLNNFGWALFFLIASAVTAGMSSWRSNVVKRRVRIGKRYLSKPTLGLRLLALLVVGILWGIPVYYLAKKLRNEPVQSSLPKVALFVDCDFQGFPLSIPAGETIHVLIVHPRIIERNDSLFDFSANNERIWPSENEAFPVPLNVGDKVYKAFQGMKCTVEKYGTPIVDNIALPIKFSGHAKPYVVVVDPLDSANFKTFTFYIVNGCPYSPMLGQVSQKATVHVLGEEGRSIIEVNAPARKLYINIFLGISNYHWISPNLPPC